MSSARDYQATFHLVVMAPATSPEPKSRYENHIVNFVFMISDQQMVDLFEELLRTPFDNPEELRDGKDDELYVFYLFMLDRIANGLVTMGADKLQCEPLGFCFLDVEFLGLGRSVDEDAPQELKDDIRAWRDFILRDTSRYTKITILDKTISSHTIH